jgi:16S rRNA (adenine1518-N6/adenine1519-N6)-dimethyltransferase
MILKKMMDRFEIKNLLDKFHLRPRKNLGQNFLIDKAILSQIIKKAGVKKGDKIIEIGPGLGALTQELLAKGAEVTAIEFDKKIIGVLKERFKTEPNLNLIYGDALDEINNIELKEYKIIANLPYQITSPFFRKALSQKNLPKMIVVMVQKEMAERVAALPHNSKRGFLSILVQLNGLPRIVGFVPRESFYPQPRVESAILSLEIKSLPKSIDKNKILKMVQAGFSQKRKKIRNSIAASLRIEALEAERMIRETGIDPSKRAEDLEISEWLSLQNKFNSLLN